MKQSKITISFSREYQDVYEFMKGQVNTSGFICKLVREKITAVAERPITASVNNSKTADLSSEIDLRKAIDGFEF